MWGWSWSSIPITTRNQTARMQLKGSKYHTFGCRNLGFGYEATTRKGYNIPKTNGWKAGTSPKNGGLYIFPFQKIPVGPFSGFQRWVFGGLSQVFYHHILHLVTAYHTSKTGMASPIAGGVLAAWYMKTINLWNGQGFQKKKFIEKSILKQERKITNNTPFKTITLQVTLDDLRSNIIDGSQCGSHRCILHPSHRWLQLLHQIQSLEWVFNNVGLKKWWWLISFFF